MIGVNKNTFEKPIYVFIYIYTHSVHTYAMHINAILQVILMAHTHVYVLLFVYMCVNMCITQENKIGGTIL